MTNPTSMVERVARALCIASGDPDPDALCGVPDCPVRWMLWIDDARAVILALREPNEGMLDAGFDSGDWGPGTTTLEDNAKGFHDAEPKTCWAAMIDAILAEDAGK